MGCVTDKGKSLRPQISQGIGGFTGAVRPIYSPVRVKTGPVRSWKAKAEHFQNVDGSENLISYSVSGDINEV